MHRQILIACLPCLVALGIACWLLPVMARRSGASWDWRRLRRLHRCQQGGVQSLAFVITMPLFMMVVMFIVQVSQLMLALIIVNYSAFATARSIVVWTPAEIIAGPLNYDESENVLPAPISEDTSLLLVFTEGIVEDSNADAFWEYQANSNDARSAKFANTYTAAFMSCAAISPSRDLGYTNALQNSAVTDSAIQLYSALVPAAADNGKIPDRIANKIAYATQNTAVRIEFIDKNTRTGPTYNPRVAVRDDDGNILYNDDGGVTRDWNPQELGWQDPITVTVTHNLALLPGPGRYLATFLVRADGKPDRISNRVREIEGGPRGDYFMTPVWASATLTNEGLKSVLPYAVDTN